MTEIAQECDTRWSVELPEGRTWDDVASAHIKWDTLTIVWKDGSDDQLFMTFSDEETDSKRPISFTVLDEDYDEITQAEGSDWYAGGGASMTDYSEMRNAIGDLWVGPRHPRANTTFEGTHMVADEATWNALNDDPTYSFEDASGAMGFCVVGDDPTELEQTAIDIFT